MLPFELTVGPYLLYITVQLTNLSNVILLRHFLFVLVVAATGMYSTTHVVNLSPITETEKY